MDFNASYSAILLDLEIGFNKDFKGFYNILRMWE